MALKFFWRCEGTTLDGTHDFTAGDNTATLNSSAAINTDAVKIGTNGLDCPTGSDFAEFVVSSGDIVSSSLGAIGFWLRMTAFVANSELLRADNSAASNNQITFSMSGTDDATGREITMRIRLVGGANVALSTTAADLAEGTWYFILGRYDEANNDRWLGVYNEDGSLRTSVEDLATDFAVPTGINRLRIGETSGGASDFHIDNVFIGDTYAEPIQNFINITSYTEYGVSGTTINPGVGAVSAIGQVPTLATEKLVTPTVGAVSIGGLSPFALPENAIGPTVGAVSLLGLVPTLASEVVATVSPDTGLVTFSGAAPTISAEEPRGHAIRKRRRGVYQAEIETLSAAPVITLAPEISQPAAQFDPPVIPTRAVELATIDGRMARLEARKLALARRRREEDELISILMRAA